MAKKDTRKTKERYLNPFPLIHMVQGERNSKFHLGTYKVPDPTPFLKNWIIPPKRTEDET